MPDKPRKKHYFLVTLPIEVQFAKEESVICTPFVAREIVEQITDVDINLHMYHNEKEKTYMVDPDEKTPHPVYVEAKVRMFLDAGIRSISSEYAQGLRQKPS